MHKISFTIEKQGVYGEGVHWATNDTYLSRNLIPLMSELPIQSQNALKENGILAISKYVRAMCYAYDKGDDVYSFCQKKFDIDFSVKVWSLINEYNCYFYSKDYKETGRVFDPRYDIHTQYRNVIVVNESDLSLEEFKELRKIRDANFISTRQCKIILLGEYYSEFNMEILGDMSIVGLKSGVCANVVVDLMVVNTLALYDELNLPVTFKSQFVRSILKQGILADEEAHEKEISAKVIENSFIESYLPFLFKNVEITVTDDKVFSNNNTHMMLSKPIVNYIKKQVGDGMVLDVFGGTGNIWSDCMVYNDSNVLTRKLARINFLRKGYDVECCSMDYKELSGHYDYVIVDPPWSMLSSVDFNVDFFLNLGSVVLFVVPVDTKFRGKLIKTFGNVAIYKVMGNNMDDGIHGKNILKVDPIVIAPNILCIDLIPVANYDRDNYKMFKSLSCFDDIVVIKACVSVQKISGYINKTTRVTGRKKKNNNTRKK